MTLYVFRSEYECVIAESAEDANMLLAELSGEGYDDVDEWKQQPDGEYLTIEKVTKTNAEWIAERGRCLLCCYDA